MDVPKKFLKTSDFSGNKTVEGKVWNSRKQAGKLFFQKDVERFQKRNVSFESFGSSSKMISLS